MPEALLSSSNFFVLAYLSKGRSYKLEIASASSKTRTYQFSPSGISKSLSELRLRGLAREAGLEKSPYGPVRQYWEITEEGEKVFLKEYSMRLQDLASLSPH